MRKIKRKSDMRTVVNNAICGSARGMFHDEVWLGKKLVERELKRVCDLYGMDYEITGNRYEKEGGVDVRKVWWFEVRHMDKVIEGIIICAGAGTVEDPLSRYDVVSYAL